MDLGSKLLRLRESGSLRLGSRELGLTVGFNPCGLSDFQSNIP